MLLPQFRTAIFRLMLAPAAFRSIAVAAAMLTPLEAVERLSLHAQAEAAAARGQFSAAVPLFDAVAGAAPSAAIQAAYAASSVA